MALIDPLQMVLSITFLLMILVFLKRLRSHLDYQEHD